MDTKWTQLKLLQIPYNGERYLCLSKLYCFTRSRVAADRCHWLRSFWSCNIVILVLCVHLSHLILTLCWRGRQRPPLANFSGPAQLVLSVERFNAEVWSQINPLKPNSWNYYTLPYRRPNLPSLISDIRTLWRSALSARVALNIRNVTIWWHWALKS